jgi:hypothetical protein
LFMGGVDLKNNKLQQYETEWKKRTQWYTKLFKRPLNISAYAAFMHYREGCTLHVKEGARNPSFWKTILDTHTWQTDNKTFCRKYNPFQEIGQSHSEMCTLLQKKKRNTGAILNAQSCQVTKSSKACNIMDWELCNAVNIGNATTWKQGDKTIKLRQVFEKILHLFTKYINKKILSQICGP